MPHLLGHLFGIAQQTGCLMSISQIHELRNGLNGNGPASLDSGDETGTRTARTPGWAHRPQELRAARGRSWFRNGNR